MTEQKPSIFISYGRDDDDPKKSFLRKLYTDLTNDKHAVWWDRVSMPTRSLKFIKEIENAITAQDRLILLIGPYAIKSDYVRYEWQHALKICKPIIPILLKRDPNITDDKDQYQQIPQPLAGDNALNALDWQDPDKYQELLDNLKRSLSDDAPLAEIPGLPELPIGYVQRDGFEALEQDLLVKTIEDTNIPVVIAPHEMIQSIQGTGGMGKSTLAVALGRSCTIRRHFVDGVYWIRLGKETDIVTRQRTLGIALKDKNGAKYIDVENGRVLLSALLADKKALLILDDVWDYQQKEAFEVLGDSCRLLITTRLLSIAQRKGVKPHKLKKLTEDEGVRLIAGWLEHKPDSDNPYEAIERQIIRLLDGHTQAIAIAAALLVADTGYSHERLLKRLQTGHTFQSLKLDDDDKNVNLEKSLFLSYDHLKADQKRFRQLGVLAPNADFDQTLIQALWDDDEFEAEDGLNRLVSGALLDRDESGRWKQHTVLGAYARALLTDDEQEQAFSRYVTHITEISQFSKLPMQDWDSQIGPDYPHIDHLGDTLTASYRKNPDNYPTLTGDFIGAVQRYVNYRPVLRETAQGRQYRGLDWLQMGAKLYGDLDQKKRQAMTLNNIGMVYSNLGDQQQALDYYQQALPIRRDEGDRAGEATTLSNIGMVYVALGDKQQALDFFQQALPIVRDVGNRSVEAMILTNIGGVYSDLGNKQQALDHFQQALPISKDMGDRSGEATILNNIGGVYSDLGNKQQALDYFQQALPIRREVGDRSGEAITLTSIGLVYSALGDPQQALDFYQQALPMHREVGNRAMEAMTLTNIGGVYSALGDKQQALAYYQQALPIVRDVGYRSGEAATLNNIGEVYRSLGQMDKALDFYQLALPIFKDVGDRSGEATTLNNMALIYFQQGDLQKAAETWEQIIPIVQEIGDVASEALFRFNLGYTYHQMGRVADAISQVERAIALLRSKGLTRDASGFTIEDMQAFLAQLKGE